MTSTLIAVLLVASVSQASPAGGFQASSGGMEPVAAGLYSAPIRGAPDAMLGAGGLALAGGGSGWHARFWMWRAGSTAVELEPLAPPVSTSTRVEQHHGESLTEWWIPRGAGIEHGWTIEAPLGDDPILQLFIEVKGADRVGIDQDGRGATISTPSGVWRYDGLTAWDASARGVSAQMVMDPGGLRIEVDLEGAAYPVVVDPLWSAAMDVKLNASEGAAQLTFGLVVNAAGDLNGDGFDDLVVGSHDSAIALANGAAFTYLGGPAGVETATEVKLTASDAAAQDSFGVFASHGAGDVNGDGYDDLIVGSRFDDDAGASSGSAYVYLGGPSGPDSSTELKLTATDGVADDAFGVDVAGAGDVNGDGYSDVLVGAQGDPDVPGGGAAYVYLGGPAGVVASSEIRVAAPDGASGALFGKSVAAAGDVDADGYDDVVVGAPFHYGAGTYSGAAYLFYGASAGVGARVETLAEPEPGAQQFFGTRVAGAGDVDSDGFDDLLVAASGAGAAYSLAGAAYVFHGGAGGLDPTRVTKLVPSDGVPFDAFGSDLDGGDVNGDGYADVVIGSPGPYGDLGTVYVYFGGAAGVDGASELQLLAPDGAANDGFGAALSASADVNGDGVDDVAVGAPQDDDLGVASGSVYVFHGVCTDADVDGSCMLDDCDDGDSSIGPNAVELCNGVDDDCDEVVDGPAALDAQTFFPDADGDGYPSDEGGITACDPPVGYLLPGSGVDCDDADAASHPGADDAVGDGIDQDCDGVDSVDDEKGEGGDDSDGSDEEEPPQEADGCGCSTSRHDLGRPWPLLAPWIIWFLRRPRSSKGSGTVADR